MHPGRPELGQVQATLTDISVGNASPARKSRVRNVKLLYRGSSAQNSEVDTCADPVDACRRAIESLTHQFAKINCLTSLYSCRWTGFVNSRRNSW